MAQGYYKRVNKKTLRIIFYWGEGYWRARRWRASKWRKAAGMCSEGMSAGTIGWRRGLLFCEGVEDVEEAESGEEACEGGEEPEV